VHTTPTYSSYGSVSHHIAPLRVSHVWHCARTLPPTLIPHAQLSMRQPCRGANSLRPHPDGPHTLLLGYHHSTRSPVYLAGRSSHSPVSAACILAGGHRSSVELRPSRNPSSNRRRRCRAGVDDATHTTGTSEMCRLCCDHGLLFTSYFLIAILHADRHEFVGNRAESEARAVCPDSSLTLKSAEGRHL
jgi:hypothetical protein